MKNLTIVERALNFLNSTQEGNVKKVYRRAIKEWNENIEDLELLIDIQSKKLVRLKSANAEKIAEDQNAFDEAFLNVIDIKLSNSNLHDYISSFEQQISNAEETLKATKDKAKEDEEEIELKIQNAQESIAKYKVYLSKIN